MLGGTNQETELSGWKAIADYLRVSPRTAQTLEKQQGLPVRRGAGLKGPVFAFSSELDEWRAEKGKPQQDAVLPVLPAEAPTRRQWLRQALIGGALVMAGGVGAAISKLRLAGGGPPTSCQTEGAVLTVFGPDNAELWHYTFPQVLLRHGPCVFADLRGRGPNETLFIDVPDDGQNLGKLICFNSKGKRQWEFIPGRAVTDNLGRQFQLPYCAFALATFRPQASKSDLVVVSSIHNYSFPDQVAILDGQTGRVVSEYWHRGHLCHLAVADLDGDGQPEILAGGVNDAPEYQQATLLVFDPRRLAGATPTPSGGSYFQGMAPVPAKRTIFFPKTAISQRQEFNRIVAVRVQPQRIVVDVAEGITKYDPAAIYEFDYALRVVNVSLSDQLQNALRELQDSGKVPREAPEATCARLKKNVKVM